MDDCAVEIVIDPEFSGLIPSPTDDELRELTESIRMHGCRDALVVWGSDGILLDGHNRYRICSELGKPYRTVSMELADRDEAKLWIIRNQFARRNLQPYQKGELALQYEAIIAAKARARMLAGVKADPSPNSAKGIDTRLELAKLSGVGHDTMAKIKVIAMKAPEPVKEALRRGATSIHAAYQDIRRTEKESDRQERRVVNAVKVASAPDVTELRGAFSTIVIDPPWDWGDEGDDDQMGRARPTYQTMPFNELLELPVASLSDQDCHLYLWITNRSLPKGFDLIEAWGFRYITCITWAKPSFGMGNYFRGQTEHVLFAVRGSQPLKRKDAGTICSWPRGVGGHSSKPSEFLPFVESCSPGPYLEMFSRSIRDGWTAWGGDV